MLGIVASKAGVRRAIERSLTGAPLALSQGELARSGAAVRAGLTELARDGSVPAERLRDVVRHSVLRDLLLDWLVSPDASVRAAAARLAGQLRIHAAVPWLEGLAAEAEPAVRRTAIDALGEMHAWPAAEALVRRLRTASADRGRLVANLALGSPDHYLGEALGEALPAPTEAALLLALGLRGGPEAAAPLLERLDTGSAAIRAVAARASGYAGGPGVLPALLVSSLDRSPRVRAEALRSVRRLRARSRGGASPGAAQARRGS